MPTPKFPHAPLQLTPLLTSGPWKPLICFYPTGFAFSRMSSKWKHTICTLSCLASFTRLNALVIHAYCPVFFGSLIAEHLTLLRLRLLCICWRERKYGSTVGHLNRAYMNPKRDFSSDWVKRDWGKIFNLFYLTNTCRLLLCVWRCSTCFINNNSFHSQSS